MIVTSGLGIRQRLELLTLLSHVQARLHFSKQVVIGTKGPLVEKQPPRRFYILGGVVFTVRERQC